MSNKDTGGRERGEATVTPDASRAALRRVASGVDSFASHKVAAARFGSSASHVALRQALFASFVALRLTCLCVM